MSDDNLQFDGGRGSLLKWVYFCLIPLIVLPFLYVKVFHVRVFAVFLVIYSAVLLLTRLTITKDLCLAVIMFLYILFCCVSTGHYSQLYGFAIFFYFYI